MNALATEKTMTVKEVAEVLGVSPETVRANGKELFPDLFENGKTTYLNEVQVTAIKMRVETHHNLQSTLEVLPKTDLEIEILVQQALVLQAEKIKRLSGQVSEMKPKAECFDRFLTATNAQSVGDVAKMLGYGRNKFFAMLRKDKIVDENNVPYSSHAKFFEVIDKPVTINGVVKNIPVTMVKPEGIVYLSKRYAMKQTA